MSPEIIESYKVLGLKPGAPAQAVREAYHDMAKVWHPDRFSGDERLLQRAQEQLKDINTAHDRLARWLAELEDEGLTPESLELQPEPRRILNEAPPVALPFPHGARTALYGAAALLLLAVAGASIYLLSWAESRAIAEKQEARDVALETRMMRQDVVEIRRHEALEAEREKQREARAEEAKQAIERNREKRQQQIAEAKRKAEEALAVARNNSSQPTGSGNTATNADALFRLAERYAAGDGVAASQTDAANCYRKAAEQGHAGAQAALGLRHATGNGVEKNLVEACKWFTLAARRGDMEADRQRRTIAMQLTPVEVGEANRLVGEFLAGHPEVR